MIPGKAINALFDALSREGFDLGDERVRAERSGTIEWEQSGETIFLQFFPALAVKKEGGLASFVTGKARKITIQRESISVWVEMPIFGTFEKRIEVER